jgi:transposase
MIPIPSGTQIWVACGATDMRRGFDGLAMMVQDVLKRSPYCGIYFCSAGSERTGSKFSGGTARACVCMRNGWSADGLSGR